MEPHCHMGCSSVEVEWLQYVLLEQKGRQHFRVFQGAELEDKPSVETKKAAGSFKGPARSPTTHITDKNRLL